MSALKKPDGTIAVEDSEKATMLCNYFSSVFTNDNSILPQFDSRVPTGMAIPDLKFSPELVFCALNRLKSKLSAGPDGFPPLLLKNTAGCICEPLATVFEVSFRLNELPSIWRTATVRPVFKKRLCY